MPDLFQPEPQPLILRDYQVTDIQRLRQAYSQGNRAVLYQLSTGGGKTVVFCHVVQGAVAKGTRTLVLCHRRELIKQASAKLTWLGVPHGIIAAGQDRDHDAQVLIASVQTIVRRLDLMPSFGLIVIDEAHHAIAGTWAKLLARQPEAKLLGVTATPARLDGRGLGAHCGGHFDAMICGPSMQNLVDAGYLAACKVLVPSVTIDTSGLRTVRGDYVESELEERVSGVTGDAVIEFGKLPFGTTALAFCVTVKHAEDVARAFQTAGYRAFAVHGKTPKDQRDAMIAGLATGETQVLTSCEVITEGLDVPSVGCVILLRPTQSLTVCLQQIGRGMRPKPDGGRLVVLDHARNCIEHGLPTELREWTLNGLKESPDKKKPKPWTCLVCSVVNPVGRQDCSECGAPKPWICNMCRRPNPDSESECSCGAARPVRRRPIADAGEMKELTANAYAHILRMSYFQLLSRPRSEAELAAYARHKGYRSGWVRHRLAEQAEEQARAAARAAADDEEWKAWERDQSWKSWPREVL